MNNNDALCLTTLEHQFGKACHALANVTKHEPGEEALVVLIRALKANPLATVDDLSKACAAELDEHVHDDVIGLAVALHGLLGPEWHVTALHFYLLEVNDDAREGETREECPFYGDDVDEVRDYWKDTFNQFDARRAKEEEAARAWLNRRARQEA